MAQATSSSVPASTSSGPGLLKRRVLAHQHQHGYTDTDRNDDRPEQLVAWDQTVMRAPRDLKVVVEEADGVFVFSAKVDIDNAAKRLGIAIRGDGFETVGGFDGRLGRTARGAEGCEETELCLRARSAIAGGRRSLCRA